ncbi:MAG: hypothetical protein MK132_27415 [Lentisphaerales bacterium]|nr:hypothetical protein [Lentisphaerales bacterium]
MRKEQSTSYSDHANYSAKDSKVTLVGNAKVVHVNEEGKKSMTNGNVIIYYLVKEMIEVHDSELDIQNK